MVCYGGSRGGAQASSVLPTPECQTFFLRFSLLLCACHRPRPAWALPPSPSSAFAPANAAFSSRVRKRPFFASAQLLVCLPSAVFSCPSCLCHRLRLTRQSRGRRISGRSSPHTASRGAPHFYVSPLGNHEATSQSIRPSPSASACTAHRHWVAAPCACRSPFCAARRPVVFFACCLCWRFPLRCPSRLGGSVSSGACAYSDSFGFGARSTLGFREPFTPGASKMHGETIVLFRPVV